MKGIVKQEPEIAGTGSVRSLETLANLTPVEDRIAALEATVTEQASRIQEQEAALQVERSKRLALEEATAPLLERSREPVEGGKGTDGATRG